MSLPMPVNTRDDTLNRWDRIALLLFAILIVAFGVMTEIRSAFQTSRKTDFGVYARAAWAIRVGQDPYTVTDNNGWHYCYPPTFAILLAPLADPYPFASQDGYLPYAASVAIWYVFSAGCTLLAVHWLASAVFPSLRMGSRRWWYARTIPLCVCFGSIGMTLGRGQVGVLVAVLVAGMFAATVRGRRITAGVWLAGAIALKVIPGLLVFFPLVRRDRRAFVGVATGLVFFLLVIPATLWGVPGAIAANRKVVDLVLAPGTANNGDQTRAEELTNITATDSQSFEAVIHAQLYPDRNTAPPAASPQTKLAHWTIGGVMLLVTIAAGWRLGRPNVDSSTLAIANQLIFLGCLCVVMILLTPISHIHYYVMLLPLVSGLWLRSLAIRPGSHVADVRTSVLLAAWGLATAVPLLPGPFFEQLRVGGLGTVATVGLWLFALGTISRSSRAMPVATPIATPIPQAA
jgi:alpha-1,2-mannosyltransferase